jgi:hypothetical protein
MGDAGYARYIPLVTRHADGRAVLRNRYGPAWWKSLLFHAVRPAMARRLAAPPIMEEGCDCTFCRCARMPTEERECAA